MGLSALLAEGETPLVVVRPHARRLLRPALLLLALVPAASTAVALVPAGPARPTVRSVVAGVALVVALRWVVWPFVLWWNTVYALTDERLLLREGVVRRTGHDLPLRGVTDVVVAQRLDERLLRSGTLAVTTEAGAQFTATDVPAVSRLQRSLIAVSDDVAERLARPVDETRARGSDDEPGGRYLDVAPPALASRDRTGDDETWHEDDDGDGDGDGPRVDGPDRREARRRGRESTRRLRDLQAQVRRGVAPDSPVEDDAAPAPAQDEPPAPPGARILRFPPR